MIDTEVLFVTAGNTSMPGSLQQLMQLKPAASAAQQHLAEHAAASISKSSSSSSHTAEAMMQRLQQQQQARAAAVAGATSVRTSTAGQWEFCAAEEVRVKPCAAHPAAATLVRTRACSYSQRSFVGALL
jgi:hypothetical protein